ncbi:MAG: nucleotide exchange factor GrpE [Deltaproteobacteria bacterium]|nr:nucleotide exchange factor GrpE [Deltaproteobacteria bacterium]
MGKKAPAEEPESTESQEQENAATAEEISQEDPLLAELEKTRKEAKTHQEQYLRTLADMENLRKRTQREKEELAKFANETILREILPVIDNLERAVEHAEQAASSDGLLEGVQMTLEQFNQVLTRFGVQPFNSVGQPFDPALHQAMGQLETDTCPANAVAQEMQKGYQLNERLLRPAMVMIAKAPASTDPDEVNNQSTETDEN